MQFNVEANSEFIEDMKVVALRRGISMSEFIRRTMTEEMEREASQQVLD